MTRVNPRALCALTKVERSTEIHHVNVLPEPVCACEEAHVRVREDPARVCESPPAGNSRRHPKGILLS